MSLVPVEPAMKILVTGASGFVGKALCSALLCHGYQVRAAYRSAKCQPENSDALNGFVAEPEAYEAIRIGEIDHKTDWSVALAGVDVVIHLAARVHVMHDDAADPLEAFRRVNTLGTEQLARAASAAGVKRLVYVSSIKVNGEETISGHRYSELDLASPQDPYGVSKWEAEQALHRIAAATGLEVVIVRPPLVYGPGVKGNFVQMLRVLAKGVPLPLAATGNLRSLVYIGNFVDALEICAIHPEAAGQTYLVSDGQDISTSDLLRQLGKAMGARVRLWHFPLSLLKFAAWLLGRSAQADRLLGSLQIDNAKIRRDLQWRPPYTLSQGLQSTAEWYRKGKE